MRDKLVLVDGHSIMNRAFYGVPPLTNSKGLHTNAIYGFMNIVLKVIEDEAPRYIIVAFDLKAPTFRHKMYEAYKGTRKGMPAELHEQIPVIKDLLCAMNICVATKEGYEADDIIGTLSSQGEKRGLDVCIVSGDRDLLQLATDHVKIHMPQTKAGKTTYEDYYAAQVLDKYKVPPAGIIELKALMGDSSDNIPGLPKVGEKTATELVVKYGTIENLKEHRDEITKNALRNTLMDHFDLAELSKVLATIDTNADIDTTIDDGCIEDLFNIKAYEIVRELEIKSLITKFGDTVKGEAVSSGFDICEISDLSEAEAVFDKLCAEYVDAASSFLIYGESRIDGVAVCIPGESVIYDIKAEGFVTSGYIAEKISKALSDAKGYIISYDLKRQFKYLGNYGLDAIYRVGVYDYVIMSYLINPLNSNYEIPGVEGIRIAEAVFVKFKELLDEIRKQDMAELLEEIEMPLVFCLNRVEQAGILVLPDKLKEYGENLQGRISELEDLIYEQAGERFNINSPKQLGEILFEKMKLPGGKKTKTGYSTAADVLEKLAPSAPIVADILEYRGLTKLKSTYADGLSSFIGEDNRIHTIFNQTITATGRLSSSEPNLQNIPVRTTQGKLLRKVFVPAEGCVFVDADYSQIELRILACMSKDEKLIEAYNKDQDIHRITASQVFGVPFDEVTPVLRRNAKAVNFGIVYGISSFGLSQDLSISRKEATEYIDNYFKTYPGIKSFLDGLVSGAKELGYVTTMFKRRRPVPELTAGNFMQKQFGERVAMNAPIQGTAADIIKIAMLRVEKALKERNLKSRIILQVHDELLIEAIIDEEEEVKEILRNEMMSAASLPVKLEVDVQSGYTWFDCH